MEEHGLILRKPMDSDQRLKKIIPTKKAMAYREKMLCDLNGLEEKLVCGIDAKDMETFSRVIEKMLQNLT